MSTYTPIATQILTSNTASVNFAGIPQFYSHLILIIQAGAATAEDIGMRFNGDSTSSYSNFVFAGNGSSNSTGTENNATSLAITSNAYLRTSVENIIRVLIPNYTNSQYKSIHVTAGAGNNVNGAMEWIGGQWRQYLPITNIQLFGKNNGYNFLSGSTFSIYGLTNGAVKAVGGDTITTDGTYWYHTF